MASLSGLVSAPGVGLSHLGSLAGPALAPCLTRPHRTLYSTARLYSARQGAGLALVYPSWLRAVPVLISVSQRFPRLLGYYHQGVGLLSVRYEFPGYPWVSLGIPGYPWVSLGIPGYPWVSLGIPGYPRRALVARRRMGAYLFSSSYLFHSRSTLGNPLVAPRYLYVYLQYSMDASR